MVGLKERKQKQQIGWAVNTTNYHFSNARAKEKGYGDISEYRYVIQQTALTHCRFLSNFL